MHSLNHKHTKPSLNPLSAFAPKPKVKLPKQGSITFVGSGDAGSAKEPKFLDLTHLGPKHKTGINVKLPEVETQGECCTRSQRTFRVMGMKFEGLRQALATGGHMQLSSLAA